MKFLNALVSSVIVFGFLTAHASVTLDPAGILRWANGEIRYINNYDALSICNGVSHIPTAREFATVAKAMGAKGILEKNQVDPNNVPPGYKQIASKNFGIYEDIFYYNNEGYKAPEGALGYLSFWTASLGYYIHDGAYLFDADDGSISYGARRLNFQLWCFPN
jgi:hypothetical protein